jgi:hypothetical protein
MAHINRLVLNASLRPMMSAEKPQRKAPTNRPTWEASGMPAIRAVGRPYSCVTAGLAIDWQTIRSYDIKSA